MADPATNPPTAKWVDIRPALMVDAKARHLLRAVVRQLIGVDGNGTAAITITSIRHEATTAAMGHTAEWAADLVLCINVLCDLRAQGWSFRSSRHALQALPPTLDFDSVNDEKARIRSAHLVERDAQLSHSSVRRFVRDMERRRLFRGEWHSIYSLMRDGRELASRLQQIAALPADQRSTPLRKVIDPYVQVVERDAICEHTGLKVADIWRYFRHTWTTTYQSTPGRKLFYLIRDRASPNHPVVGIGALGSAIVQLSVRDDWIGWTGPQFIEAIRRTPTASWAHWLDRSIRQLIDAILVSDFVRDGVLRRSALEFPTEGLVQKLLELSKAERRVHHLFPTTNRHKKAAEMVGDTGWRDQAKTHLFRSKRAKALADLLDARLRLQAAGFISPTQANLQRALNNTRAVRAMQSILRRIKATHVGIDMMDITVCGAIAPYNRLLAGKLVSLLMASPAVIESYNQRYRRASSVIASSVAGKPVRRTPRLVLLGTTSLYGVGASQYNRLRFPAKLAGGREGESLEFVELGKTIGYGSYHFSAETMAAIDPVLRRQQRGRPVNSIFGEGVNPKLRKVRSALDSVGFPSDLLLQHGSPRIVYAVPLASNFRDVLVSRSTRPSYILPTGDDAVAAIVDYWRDRWLSRRIDNLKVLEDVAMNTGSYPVTHGARVSLPPVLLESGTLFDQDEPPRGTISAASNYLHNIKRHVDPIQIDGD